MRKQFVSWVSKARLPSWIIQRGYISTYSYFLFVQSCSIGVEGCASCAWIQSAKKHRHSISCMILVQTSHVPPNTDSLELDLDLDSSLTTSRYPQRASVRSGRTVKLCIWSKKVVGKRTWLSLRSKNQRGQRSPFRIHWWFTRDSWKKWDLLMVSFPYQFPYL